MESPCHFLDSRGQNICETLKKWTKGNAFVYILGFICCGICHLKTDLHTKYLI